MALNLDFERARSFGNWAPYPSVDAFLVTDPNDPSKKYYDFSNCTTRLSELPAMLLHPVLFSRARGPGTDGTGWDWRQLPSLLLPGFLSFLVFMAVRYVCREPLSRFGVFMGVVSENETAYRRRLAEGKRGTAALSRRSQRRIFKFQNQLWLAFFYAFSSLFGATVLRGFGWFQFPLSRPAAVQLLVPHPWNPPMALMLYYYQSFGFYLAEMFSLLVLERHVKRMDFLEYFLHHCLTMSLMTASHVGWEHKFGCYVLFLHDVSDIMLCVSKVLHYVVDADRAREAAYNKKHTQADGKRYKKPFIFKYVLTEWTVNGTVICFMAGFFFFRMYCLPMMAQATLLIGPRIRHANFTAWFLVYLLSIFLQLLHVYWSVLMVTLAVKVLVFNGERKDIRSESETDALERAEQQAEGEGDYALWNEVAVLSTRKVTAMDVSHAAASDAGVASSNANRVVPPSADRLTGMDASGALLVETKLPAAGASTPDMTPTSDQARRVGGRRRHTLNHPGETDSTSGKDESSQADDDAAGTVVQDANTDSQTKKIN